MLIHKTIERKAYDKPAIYWDEYRLEKGKVIQYRFCKTMNIHDLASYNLDEWIIRSWSIDDLELPGWLKEKVLLQFKTV